LEGEAGRGWRGRRLRGEVGAVGVGGALAPGRGGGGGGLCAWGRGISRGGGW